MGNVQNLIDERNLPDLLKGVKSAKDFEKKKEKIKKLLLEREYGEIPRKPDHMFVEETGVYDRFAAGKAIVKKLSFTFEMDGKSFSIPVLSAIPRDKKNCPTFVYIDFWGGDSNKYMPTEEIVERGFALFTFKYG